MVVSRQFWSNLRAHVSSFPALHDMSETTKDTPSRRWRNGNTNIVLNGMPLLGGPEELSERRGKSCWKWKDSNTRKENKIKEWNSVVLDVAKVLERVSLPVVWA